MSKMLRVREVAHANDFAHVIALLGKPVHKHDQIKSRNMETNCTIENRKHSSKKFI